VALIEAFPPAEFLTGDFIAAAGIVSGEKAAVDRSDHFRLAAGDPALDPRRRKISNCDVASVWPHDRLA